jgi:hypothetical protein
MSEPVELDPESKEGQEPLYFPPVDPDTLQTVGTGTAALGLAFATGGASSAVEAGMTGFPEMISSAVAALAFTASTSLSLGLALIGVGVVLNVASLALRHRSARKQALQGEVGVR